MNVLNSKNVLCGLYKQLIVIQQCFVSIILFFIKWILKKNYCKTNNVVDHLIISNLEKWPNDVHLKHFQWHITQHVLDENQ
jgi:hypothetical protein